MNSLTDKLATLRHSASHLLAMAARDFDPEVKLAIGPAIDNGFYYDFLFSRPFSEADLPVLEKKIAQLVKDNLPVEKKTISRQEALKNEKAAHQPFKVELIEDLPDEEVSYYGIGDFWDLCRGPHVAKTAEVGAVKLLSVAGAYWRGDEKKAMLTRIYGTAFPTKKELDSYLVQLEEARKRDHRRLGRQLDLFTFSDLIGSGLPLFTPKGALVRRLLTEFIESLQSKEGYTQVWTPQITKADLFKTSGHYDKYKDGMFRVSSNYSEEEMFLKPMNCPQHTQIYLSQPRSYRDLPVRYTDFAMLYRDEKPGELNGLARVRSFSQDDCHVFCREDQVDEEIDKMLAMTKQVMTTFGFKFRYRLSTRDPEHPEKYIGDPKTWDKVEKWAEKIMKRNKIDYFDGPGEAAFYAPKMDLLATDALGREWQLSTVQIDYFMPARFGLSYTDEQGKKQTPVMLHRAIVGSPERFMMILLEQYNGALPVWLAPVQAIILPVSEKFSGYGDDVLQALKGAGVRVELPLAQETLGKRIRAGEVEKVPYILIVGDREKQNRTVTVRERHSPKQQEISIGRLIEQIDQKVRERIGS